MKRWIQAETRSRGQALIMAMIFLLALTFLGFGLVTMATLDSASAKSLRLSSQVLEAAEEGVIAGMAYSADPVTGFKARTTVAPGNSVTFKSGDYFAADKKKTLQYTAKVIMRGIAPSPPGSAAGTGKCEGCPTPPTYMLVEVQSTGFIYERPNRLRSVDFNFSNTPTINRNISALARIMIVK